MHLFVTGGTGLIGRRLVEDRLRRGDDVTVLSRNRQKAQALLKPGRGRLEILEGDPAAPGPWQEAAAGCHAVVNLAGAGVADRRWTAAYKKVLADSRIESTKRVVAAIARGEPRHGVLVNASAVGYYGDRGETELDESATPGDDFLARLCVRWEQAACEAEAAGVRVVLLRFGVVLDRRGGAFAKMVPVFKLGLGGPLGSGRQYFPWVHFRDVLGLADLALRDPSVRGPVNVVAPEATTNLAFTRTLARVLGRPAFLRVPRWGLRLLLGEVADAPLCSQRVVPAEARRHGYAFTAGELRGAVIAALGSR